MNSPALSRLLAALFALSLAGCGGPKVTGTYEGVCKNTTFGGEAQMRLILNETDKGYLSGNMTLSGILSGGGFVTGRRDGKNLTLNTSDSLGGDITWMGTIGDRRIVGTYVATPHVVATIALGSGQEGGAWVVEKVK